MMRRLDQIIHHLRLSQPRIIGIDGQPGVGKTKLASQLSARIRCNCLHLDSFLVERQKAFTPSIQYDVLHSAIINNKGALIIEGICLLEVLSRLSLAPDYFIFVEPSARYRSVNSFPTLRDEVSAYLAECAPQSKANVIVSLEDIAVNSSYDVDIAYIKSKTIVSVTLAIGGLAQTIVGALLLNTGLNEPGTATLKIMGAEMSATGLGGIVLCTSVMWGYFAYLSRPKFSSRSETRNTNKADGSSEAYEFKSSTEMSVEPTTKGQTRQ